MLLVSANVGPFKSIDNPQEVKIAPNVTVLVGMNEAGKTVFLQALQKSDDVLGVEKFNTVDDYPRKNLTTYQKRHEAQPATATVLTYKPSDAQVLQLSALLKTQIPAGFTFTESTDYKNGATIGISIDNRPAINAIAATPGISSDFSNAVKRATSFDNIPNETADTSLTEADEACIADVKKRITAAAWRDVIGWEAYQWLRPRMPKFLYFGDYEVLPSKMNLAELASRQSQAVQNPGNFTSEHRGVLALLRMADISLSDFSTPGNMESLIARIEAVSINLTDQIMQFWKQNEDLQVKIDIRSDPNDVAPYNNGPNLYIRIANNRHRGVTTPFKQRSRGFVWFFSFLVWFDSVQHQIASGEDKLRPLILLLDEPGLSLHALAQRDFLNYIDDLAKRHQVLYSTHSPFMVHSDRLQEVRLVEDRIGFGTVVTDNVMGNDKRTVFPLQAALGWTIAQNLFINERNLLVEGPADLVYLQAVSSLLETQGRVGLRDDVTIVPVGGLDKVVTFIALLGANDLKIAVLYDYKGSADQRLVDMVRQKIIAAKAVMDASQFRDLANLGVSGLPTDMEDLFEPALYLQYFNAAYKTQLAGNTIAEADLPPGDRIIDRLERCLIAKTIRLRPSGGFNHYAPASAFASNPPAILPAYTLARFEALFKAVNALF